MKSTKLSEKKKLGIIIKQERKKMNISQAKLADEVVYDQSIISRIEKGYENIHEELYMRVLNYFGFVHQQNNRLDSEIDTLIQEVYYCYVNLAYEEINELNKKINFYIKKNHNLFKYYDLLTLKLVINLLLDNRDLCDELIKKLENVYEVCSDSCQVLYLLINIFNDSRKNNFEELEMKYHDYPENGDGIISYLKAMIYLMAYNYANTTYYLMNAIEHFKTNGNFKRLARSELQLNRILLKEKDYSNVKERVLHLLERVDEIHEMDVNRAYFQLAYSTYQLGEYKRAIFYTSKIELTKYKIMTVYVDYIQSICNYKIYGEIKDIREVQQDNILTYLYFNHDENIFELIEKYIKPHLERFYYLNEYFYYCGKLLEHYWKTRNYKEYKQLSERIHKIMHIL